MLQSPSCRGERPVGPTGLWADQFDPDTRQALGNYPQAYNQLGLINAALALDAG